MNIHAVFDLLAWASGALLGYLVRRRYLARIPNGFRLSQHPGYIIAVALCTGLGALLAGGFNMALSGLPPLGHSIAGAIAGGIVGAEGYKLACGIRGSTGLVFVAPLAAGIVIGRWGCFLSGLPDYTYGIATSLPWGVNFGDGIPRHPVQLYESFAMLGFLVWFLAALERSRRSGRSESPSPAIRGSFYFLVGFYALQRFCWEFLKPYARVLGPFDMFHFLMLGLFAYSVVMLWESGGGMNKPAGQVTTSVSNPREIKNHLFFGQTTSLCETCLAPVPAKILIEGDLVWFQKRCLEHGVQKTLVSTDAAYYRRCHDYLKPPDKPKALHSRTEFGCPYDCGLCPDHEQHSCLALIEVNEACNLNCPVCFAESSTARTTHRSLEEIERMMDLLVAAEGEPDLLQISGGEPTIHPQILEILRLAKSKPIRHVMLNTNGVRIAKDKDFVKALADLRPGFEVYLQFDSLQAAALENIRGADLRRIRDQALANLEAAGISTTLVCVIKKGVNDGELGAVIDHALGYACVRGVTFQPIQDAGRNLDPTGKTYDKNRDRVLLTDIRRGIIEQSPHFGADDLMPLPCNPDAIAIGYGLRQGREVTPITRFFDQQTLLDAAPNAITFERHPELRQRLFDLMSLSCTGENTEPTLANFLCCLPQFELPKELGYDKVFRVVIVQFLDRFNFCIASVKRSCIHFVTPEKQIIPFDTYNLFYRNGLVDKFRQGARPMVPA